MGLDITAEALEAFIAGGDDGPVVLVNLVRVRPGREEAYLRYLDAVGPCIERVGATAVWVGDAVAAGTLIGDQDYDRAAVVRYPSRSALAALLGDPAFVATTSLRHEALEAGILHAFRG
jgi:uncharacterized protein (DUF1330 family)